MGITNQHDLRRVCGLQMKLIFTQSRLLPRAYKEHKVKKELHNEIQLHYCTDQLATDPCVTLNNITTMSPTKMLKFRIQKCVLSCNQGYYNTNTAKY